MTLRFHEPISLTLMSDPITIEDIYKLFQHSQEEANRSKAELDQQLARIVAEADRRAAETKAEADRRAAEADRRAAELDQQLARIAAEADRRAAEADRRAAEADRRAAELDQQLARIAAEADRRAAEADRRAAESKAEAERRAAEADRRAAESKAEADRRAAESKAEADRRAAEADRRAAESKAEADRRAAESKAEADRRSAETEKRLASLDAMSAQLTQMLNGITTRWGRFVENLVAPNIVRIFQARGIAVQEIHPRMRAARGSLNLEVDIFAVNGAVAVVVEVKSRLTQKNINRFIKNLGQFKQAFPAYKDYQIYGAVAAIEIDQGADRYAYKQGLFVIKQSGNTVEIDNDEDFQPTVW
jgi:chemotaxis protein histidine kinase CheA